MSEHVRPSFTYSVDFQGMEADIDPSVDRLVRCKPFACFMIKIVAHEDRPITTYFLSEEAFDFLADDPVGNGMSGLEVEDRDFLWDHEHEALIATRALSLEELWGDE